MENKTIEINLDNNENKMMILMSFNRKLIVG